MFWESGAGAGEQTRRTGPPSNCLLLSGIREGSLVNPSPICYPHNETGLFYSFCRSTFLSGFNFSSFPKDSDLLGSAPPIKTNSHPA